MTKATISNFALICILLGILSLSACTDPVLHPTPSDAGAMKKLPLDDGKGPSGCDPTNYDAYLTASVQILPGITIAGTTYDFGIGVNLDSQCKPLPPECYYKGHFFKVELQDADQCGLSLSSFEKIQLVKATGQASQPYLLDQIETDPATNCIYLPDLFPIYQAYFKWDESTPCPKDVSLNSFAGGGLCVIGNLTDPLIPNPYTYIRQP